MPRNVVYTCLFGYSEPFADHDYSDSSVDYVCFTDDPSLTSSRWQFRVVENRMIDSHRLSKSFKHLPHRHLGAYARSLYIDNTIRLKVAPSEIFGRFDDDLVMFKHPWRDCVYEEAEAVIESSYDDPDLVRRQMRFYRALGYPANNGLSAASFLLRNHHNAALQAVSEDWHGQVLRYSKRDQLSWNVCAWYRKFRFSVIDEPVADNAMIAWPVVDGGVRLPRDFDDEIYLSLNRDVRAGGMNPRQHYLQYGAGEGRAYKSGLQGPLAMHLKARVRGLKHRIRRWRRA
jgi:hypothetical protein